MKRLQQLSTLTLLSAASAVTTLVSGCKIAVPDEGAEYDLRGDPKHGKELVFANGCVACHLVPGIAGDPAHVGPPLTDWSQRKYIAGSLPNEPEQLILWILNPQEIEPGTAMPDLELTEAEARDIAAYLYSL